MNEEELNAKFSEYESKIIQLQQQIGEIEKALYDMNFIKEGLTEIKGKVNDEIFAPIGRGIFVKSKLCSEKVLVDIGEGSFVEKSIEETKEIIEKQKNEFTKIQNFLNEELMKINNEINNLMKRFQEEKENKIKSSP